MMKAKRKSFRRRERERENVCVWKDPREKRLTSRFFFFSLSLSLTPPCTESSTVKEREDSKDAAQNEQ
jgi:hypothetical protein